MNILDFTDSPNQMDDSISTKAYFKAIDIKTVKLREEINQLERLRSVIPTWSVEEPIDKVKVPSTNGKKVIGVYKIIYRPTDEVVSIGQGVVNARRGRHVSVFKHSVKEGYACDITHEGGATSGSEVAQKMYKEDSNLDNWYFSWCNTKSKPLANQLETELQNQINPRFNASHMAGNN